MSTGTSITTLQCRHQFVSRNGTSCSKNTKDIPSHGCCPPPSNLQAVELEFDGRVKSEERKLQLKKKRRSTVVLG